MCFSCFKSNDVRKVANACGKGGIVFCCQNCSSDRENVLKFEAEGQEFAKCLGSLEQFFKTMKCQNNSW